MDAVREFVLRHHTLSEAVVANVQMAGTFVPGRWGEWEVPFEAGSVASPGRGNAPPG